MQSSECSWVVWNLFWYLHKVQPFSNDEDATGNKRNKHLEVKLGMFAHFYVIAQARDLKLPKELYFVLNRGLRPGMNAENNTQPSRLRRGGRKVRTCRRICLAGPSCLFA